MGWVEIDTFGLCLDQNLPGTKIFFASLNVPKSETSLAYKDYNVN